MWSTLLSGMLCLAQPLPPEEGEATPPPPRPQRWFLMENLQGTYYGWLLDGNRLQLSGWTDMSYTASSVAPENLPLGFNYKANQFLLQQNWLRFERLVDPSSTTPTWGFRCDTILPGSDYRFTVARGLFDGQLPALYGIDPIQFYGELYLPEVGRGLDLKFGRFFAQYGVEANDAVSNALSSHAYTFIYDPFTHTGLLATLKLTDVWAVQGGVVLGSDVFIDPAANPTYLGSVRWTEPGGRNSALFSVILGNGRFDQKHEFHNPEVFDLVYTHIIDARLNYALETLYGFTTNVPDIGFANWLGVVHYLTYAFTPRVSGTVRLEFFNDAQGQRTGFEGLYTAVTAGMTFKPAPAVIFRPEVRYDFNSDSRPFENQRGLFTANMDVILRW
jgi:hypothetical protein